MYVEAPFPIWVSEGPGWLRLKDPFSPTFSLPEVPGKTRNY